MQDSSGKTCGFYAVLGTDAQGSATVQGFALAGNERNTSGCEYYSHVLAKDLDTTLALMRAVFDAGQAGVVFSWFWGEKMPWASPHMQPISRLLGVLVRRLLRAEEYISCPPHSFVYVTFCRSSLCLPNAHQ